MENNHCYLATRNDTSIMDALIRGKITKIGHNLNNECWRDFLIRKSNKVTVISAAKGPIFSAEFNVTKAIEYKSVDEARKVEGDDLFSPNEGDLSVSYLVLYIKYIPNTSRNGEAGLIPDLKL